MTFEEFQITVLLLIEKAGGNIEVVFYTDDGKYIAKCSDGTKIVGNSTSVRLAVEWNRGNHKAMVTAI